MQNIKLNITGMTCKHCSGSVQQALSAVPGVTNAEVNLENKSAQVQCGNDVNIQALIKAVDDIGFEASV